MPRIKYIEFLGDKTGDNAVVTFLDENREPIREGVFRLNRYAFETMYEQFGEWLENTKTEEVTLEINPQ